MQRWRVLLVCCLLVFAGIGLADADTQRLPVVYGVQIPPPPATFPADPENRCFAVKPSIPIYVQHNWYWSCNLNDGEGGNQGAALFVYDGSTSRMIYAAGTLTSDGTVWLNGTQLMFSYFRQDTRAQQNVQINLPQPASTGQ